MFNLWPSIRRQLSKAGALVLALIVSSATQPTKAQEMLGHDPSGGCICDPDPCYPAPPRCGWYFRSEGLALRRDVLEHTNIATWGTGADATLALSRDDLDEPFSAGARFVIGRTFGDSPYQIEFSYFLLSQWDNPAGVVDSGSIMNVTPGTLFTAFTEFGDPANNLVDYANSIQIRETSYLDNGELNFKQWIQMPAGTALNAIIGVRHIGNRETLEYASVPTQVPGLGNPASVYTHTRNDLWGPQIGGLFEAGVAPNAWISFEIKGAICNNSASSETAANLGGVGYEHGRYVRNGSAYVADFNLSLFWRPTAHVSARCGYQALWIDGLALALENSQAPLGTIVGPGNLPLHRDGTVLYHGPYAGLEVSW